MHKTGDAHADSGVYGVQGPSGTEPFFPQQNLFVAPTGLGAIIFYPVTYTYIDRLNLIGQVSTYKTLEMRTAQRLAANLMNRRGFGGRMFPKN